MNEFKFTVLLIFLLTVNISLSQTVDLTSVDEFFKVTATLKEGKGISEKQWNDFDSSSAYKTFAEGDNKFLINTIKSSIQMVFGNGNETKMDSILSITKKEMAEDKKLLLKRQILTNYISIRDNYDSLRLFRENYNFNALIKKSIQRLGSFLEKPIDSTIKFKPVFFFFLNPDGGDEEDAIYIDFNLVYKMTEQQRIDFLAHEYFHNYRRYFENHDFNYKCDLNFMLDMIQNEGIADQIDKSQGYENYYSKVLKSPEMTKIMVDLYNRAEDDLEKIQNVIMKYDRGDISENRMIDELLEVYKFNGHAIGFYMSNRIVRAGYKNEMIKSFYNPYEFYSLYNKAAKKQNLFQFSDEFMGYLNDLTKDYYN